MPEWPRLDVPSRRNDLAIPWGNIGIIGSPKNERKAAKAVYTCRVLELQRLHLGIVNSNVDISMLNEASMGTFRLTF